MGSIQRAKLPAGLSHLPPLERAAVSIWCPECQSDQIRRSRMRGIGESLLAFLLIRPYQCEECDYRFSAGPFDTKPIQSRWHGETNDRNSNLPTACQASQDGHTSHTDMD